WEDRALRRSREEAPLARNRRAQAEDVVGRAQSRDHGELDAADGRPEAGPLPGDAQIRIAGLSRSESILESARSGMRVALARSAIRHDPLLLESIRRALGGDGLVPLEQTAAIEHSRP